MIPSSIVRNKSAGVRHPRRVEIPENRRHYFLQVETEVPAVKRDIFAAAGRELVQTFIQAGLHPTTSAWYTNAGPIVVMNYWDMGTDANALLDAELVLPDVPKFNAFNTIVQKEVKNIVVPIAADQCVPSPNRQGGKLSKNDYRYLHVKIVIPTVHLAEFAARVESHIKLFTHQRDWYLGNTYLGITGTEGAVSQLWLIRSTAEGHKKIATLLADAPWLQKDLLREESPRFQVLRATESDPVLDSSADTLQ